MDSNDTKREPNDIKSPKGPVRGNVSQRLLKLVHSKDQPDEMHRHLQEEQGEDIRIDERWLTSYADSMTLLCGFFIMLFAMSTLDPVKLKKVQESTEKQFGAPNAKKMQQMIAVDAPPIVDLTDTVKEQKQIIEALQAERAELAKQLEAQKAVESKVTAESKTLDEQTRSLNERLKVLETEKQTLVDQNTALTAQKITLEAEKVEKDSKLKMFEVKIQELTKQIPVVVPVAKPEPKPKVVPLIDPAKLKELERQVATLKESVTTLETTVVKKDEQIVKLQEELRLANSTSGFAAFVMSWSTRDHDVDLVVEDPRGKTFDFKNRQHKGAPGLLVLDTRKGPGVEVWQSDGIVPGVYKFKYLFYNSYGNADAVPVTGTLFTAKGRIELPVMKLVFGKNKTAEFEVKIDENGKATLLK